MKSILFMLCLFVGVQSQAQISKVSLQASGLTCSMCSKAVKTALEEVGFVEKVQVDIKNQQYNLSFKEGSTVDLDALNKAVQDAGFSVASMKATASVSSTKLAKDEHLKIGEQTFHFLNAANQTVNGQISFSVVDKGFVSAKDFKKYASMTKMACVQTGRMAKCCTAKEAGGEDRIYHVII
ncbi:MAG TPA: heavy-metal-associated domain-containing protein [Flavisolibacter sp.]|nr:heavy-metal-associated domain-containing protein [Flavisolibacter sp.]